MLLNARNLLALAGIAMVSLFANLSFGAEMAPSSGVDAKEAYADAQFLATLHPQSRVMAVSGSSMHPYFAEGAFIVVKPITMESLREGMVVVYRNRFGETVAHRLIARNGGAWVAKGFNNEVADSTPVTAENVLGVVFAAVHADTNAGLRYAAMAKVPVALAASAR